MRRIHLSQTLLSLLPLLVGALLLAALPAAGQPSVEQAREWIAQGENLDQIDRPGAAVSPQIVIPFADPKRGGH